MISFYILSEKIFLKCEGLFDVRLVSISEYNYGFAVIFYKGSYSPESHYLINY